MRMRVAIGLTIAWVCSCSGQVAGRDAGTGNDAGDASYGTPQDCSAAGGKCLVGGAINLCAKQGPDNTCNCNPVCDPGGSLCCLVLGSSSGSGSDSGSTVGCDQAGVHYDEGQVYCCGQNFTPTPMGNTCTCDHGQIVSDAIACGLDASAMKDASGAESD